MARQWLRRKSDGVLFTWMIEDRKRALATGDFEEVDVTPEQDAELITGVSVMERPTTKKRATKKKVAKKATPKPVSEPVGEINDLLAGLDSGENHQ